MNRPRAAPDGAEADAPRRPPQVERATASGPSADRAVGPPGPGMTATSMWRRNRSVASRAAALVGNRAFQRMLVQRDGEHDGLTDLERYQHTLGHAGTTQARWDAAYVPRATFLGLRISNGVHQELVDRLTIAEQHLRDQHPGRGDDEIATTIGLYSISGRRAPGNAVGGSALSNHSYGIAIDVNYRGNPFVGRSTRVGEIFNRASMFMRGEEFRIRQQQAGTVEEIRARYARASADLQAYLRLRDHPDEVEVHLRSRGRPSGPEEVQAAVRQIAADYEDPQLRRDFATNDRANPRDPAAGFIDLTAELVEALAGRAGLYWGGQYRTGKDIMHFDWRQGTVRTHHRI
jgi:hypothetical protein